MQQRRATFLRLFAFHVIGDQNRLSRETRFSKVKSSSTTCRKTEGLHEQAIGYDWYLRFGPRRFGELRRDLVTVSSKVLTAKLRDLEADGLVEREVIDASPPQVSYSLSARGRAFEPVFQAMINVSERLNRLDAAELRNRDRGASGRMGGSALRQARAGSPQRRGR